MPNSDGVSVGGDTNFFYSFNVGPVHFISFSTEFYYFFMFGFEQMERQYEWLKQDLMVNYLVLNFIFYNYLILEFYR